MLPDGVSTTLLQALNQALSLVVITALFAAMFKVLPDAKVAWRDVWVGAAVTAVLFVVGKFLIGLYLGRSNPGKAFGAAGSLAVLLVWIYYSAMILLYGAEFTQTWADRRGQRHRAPAGRRADRAGDEAGAGGPAVASLTARRTRAHASRGRE